MVDKMTFDAEPTNHPTNILEMPNALLVEGLRAGDPEAFEELLNRYEAPLYRFFYYSHGDHDQAQDQCGETFANMIEAIHKMRGDADSLRSFIFGVARNVMRREWRKKKPLAASEAQLGSLTDPRPSAYREAAGRQTMERALEAIECFGDPARQILLLRFVEQLPLAEVARVMEMPLGTITGVARNCVI
jgi:RNA polymerase sigma-70 factor (ECF subfamily)